MASSFLIVWILCVASPSETCTCEVFLHFCLFNPRFAAQLFALSCPACGTTFLQLRSWRQCLSITKLLVHKPRLHCLCESTLRITCQLLSVASCTVINTKISCATCLLLATVFTLRQLCLSTATVRVFPPRRRVTIWIDTYLL
jgi:hypothetical protein